MAVHRSRRVSGRRIASRESASRPAPSPGCCSPSRYLTWRPATRFASAAAAPVARRRITCGDCRVADAVDAHPCQRARATRVTELPVFGSGPRAALSVEECRRGHRVRRQGPIRLCAPDLLCRPRPGARSSQGPQPRAYVGRVFLAFRRSRVCRVWRTPWKHQCSAEQPQCFSPSFSRVAVPIAPSVTVIASCGRAESRVCSPAIGAAETGRPRCLVLARRQSPAKTGGSASRPGFDPRSAEPKARVRFLSGALAVSSANCRISRREARAQAPGSCATSAPQTSSDASSVPSSALRCSASSYAS